MSHTDPHLEDGLIHRRGAHDLIRRNLLLRLPPLVRGRRGRRGRVEGTVAEVRGAGVYAAEEVGAPRGVALGCEERRLVRRPPVVVLLLRHKRALLRHKARPGMRGRFPGPPPAPGRLRPDLVRNEGRGSRRTERGAVRGALIRGFRLRLGAPPAAVRDLDRHRPAQVERRGARGGCIWALRARHAGSGAGGAGCEEEEEAA
eukprot:2075914-Rhodomonas_salina.1